MASCSTPTCFGIWIELTDRGPCTLIVYCLGGVLYQTSKACSPPCEGIRGSASLLPFWSSDGSSGTWRFVRACWICHGSNERGPIACATGQRICVCVASIWNPFVGSHLASPKWCRKNYAKGDVNNRLCFRQFRHRNFRSINLVDCLGRPFLSKAILHQECLLAFHAENIPLRTINYFGLLNNGLRFLRIYCLFWGDTCKLLNSVSSRRPHSRIFVCNKTSWGGFVG